MNFDDLMEDTQLLWTTISQWEEIDRTEVSAELYKITDMKQLYGVNRYYNTTISKYMIAKLSKDAK